MNIKAFNFIILILITIAFLACHENISNCDNQNEDNKFMLSELKKMEKVKVLFAADFYCINKLSTTKGDR